MVLEIENRAFTCQANTALSNFHTLSGIISKSLTPFYLSLSFLFQSQIYIYTLKLLYCLLFPGFCFFFQSLICPLCFFHQVIYSGFAGSLPMEVCISENVLLCSSTSFKICSASCFLFLWRYWFFSFRLYYCLYKYVRPIKLSLLVAFSLDKCWNFSFFCLRVCSLLMMPSNFMYFAQNTLCLLNIRILVFHWFIH